MIDTLEKNWAHRLARTPSDTPPAVSSRTSSVEQGGRYGVTVRRGMKKNLENWTPLLRPPIGVLLSLIEQTLKSKAMSLINDYFWNLVGYPGVFRGNHFSEAKQRRKIYDLLTPLSFTGSAETN